MMLDSGGQDRLEYNDRCAWNFCHLQIKLSELTHRKAPANAVRAKDPDT